ncbi:MAG: sensor histidine kinase [Streptomyces sp.]|nr:sensor histidine kinase [Streptomyces sp.]
MTGWKGYGLQAMFALYAAGRHGRVWHAWLAAVVVGLFYPAVALAVHLVTGMASRDSGSLGWFVPLLLVGAGRLMHLRAETTRRRQDEIAEEVVQTERRHIARELHDVVAHNITTMQVLIGAARTTMTRDLPDAEAALRSAERAGREAMAEMRQLLHVLRADELNGTSDHVWSNSAGGQEPGSLAHMQPHTPASRANALPVLVGRAREAGQPVSLEVSGHSRRLPAAIDHAIHRIVQESLTNARKHAGNVPVRVSIDYGPTMVEVKVVNEEADATHDARRPRTPPGNGFGLTGMAERVALCGGRLETGPLPSGGFSVHAHFPLSVSDALQLWPAARKPGERKSAEEGDRHDQGRTC